MQAIVDSFFNVQIMQAAFPLLLQGFWRTLLLCLAVVPAGLAGGLVVALLATSRPRLVRWPVVAFVDLF